MTGWLEYLRLATEHQASDVFFVAGKAPCEKVEGHMHPLNDRRLLPEDTEQIISELYQTAGRSMEHYRLRGGDVFSFSIFSRAAAPER